MTDVLIPIGESIAFAAFHDWYEALKDRARDQDLFSADLLFQLLRGAGQGDLDSLRKLANATVISALDELPADRTDHLWEGLSFARLAAVKSGEHEDKLRVAAMLGLISAYDPDNTIAEAGESLAWLEAIANDGDEDAASILAAHTVNERVEVLEVAKNFRPLVNMLWETE